VSPQTRVGSPDSKMRAGNAESLPGAASNGSPVVRNRPASRSAVAWTPNGDMEHRTWILEGRFIGALGRGSPWWIGDWLLYGTARGWGERYSEAAKITGYDPKSLRNMRYVSSQFDLSLRRDNLTWSHHVLVAAFEADEQNYWFDRAAADKLSVDDLRVELRSSRRDSKPAPGEKEDPNAASVSAKGLTCPHCGGEVPFPRDSSIQEAELGQCAAAPKRARDKARDKSAAFEI
jgi:hypothetical protein